MLSSSFDFCFQVPSPPGRPLNWRKMVKFTALCQNLHGLFQNCKGILTGRISRRHLRSRDASNDGRLTNFKTHQEKLKRHHQYIHQKLRSAIMRHHTKTDAPPRAQSALTKLKHCGGHEHTLPVQASQHPVSFLPLTLPADTQLVVTFQGRSGRRVWMFTYFPQLEGSIIASHHRTPPWLHTPVTHCTSQIKKQRQGDTGEDSAHRGWRHKQKYNS